MTRSLAFVFALGLAGCMSTGVTVSELPPATTEREALALSLFQEFCLTPGSPAASEAAIRASGRFATPSVSVFENIGSRFAIYPLANDARASVSIITGSVGELSCSVGVDNKGPNLFEDGSVSYSG